jgi:hypothetical protein
MSAGSTGPAAAQSADQAEIRSVVMRQSDTWNQHDAKAYAVRRDSNAGLHQAVGAMVDRGVPEY